MMMNYAQGDLSFANLAGLGELLATGQISARHLTWLALERVGTWSAIGGYSDLLEQSAMQEASASDRRYKTGEQLGPLDGIPVAVKDIIDTTPARCGAGLPHQSDYRPVQDATIVSRLRAAGATILGVTQTDSGAFGTSTPAVINPLDPGRIAGGSSGGSGAVLAAGLAYVTIGTDTAGSIRIPAACCATCGFKPSQGQLPMHGIRPLAPSLDHVGPMARSVADLQIIYAVLSDTTGSLDAHDTNLTVGLPRGYYDDAHPLIVAAMSEIVDKLVQAGLTVREVDFPSADRALEVHRINALREIADYHLEHFAEVWTSYPDLSRQTIGMGKAIADADYDAARQARAQLRLEVERSLEHVDLLIAPTLPTDAPRRDASSLAFGGAVHSVLSATIRYTALFNQTGHPVVAMPGLLLPDGRAISIQVIGRMQSDHALLARARQLESVLGVSIDYASLLEAKSDEILKTRNRIENGAPS